MEGDETQLMNLLSALAPTSRPVDPFDVGGNIQAEVATRAAIKVMQVQKDMAGDVLRLLDPAVGTRVNRRA